MDPDRVVVDNLRALCASAYVQDHLRVDYIEETSLAATLVHECTIAAHAKMRQFMAPGVDPFVSLFYEFDFNQLQPYNEAWCASAESIAHLRKALQSSSSKVTPLRGELAWIADDTPFAPTIPEEMDIILSRQAKSVTPVIGNSGITKLDPKTLFPTAIPLHDDSNLPSLEQLICPPPALDPTSRAAVLSYLQSTKVETSHPSTFTFTEPPVPLTKADDRKDRPMSPPIFPRVPLKPTNPPTQHASLHQVIQTVVKPVPIAPFEPDLAQESMRIVNGWAVLVDPQSTPPPLNTTTELIGTAGVDVDVDELEWTPPPPREAGVKGGPKGKGKGVARKRGSKVTKNAKGGRVKAIAAMSPSARPSLNHLEDMDFCPIPRERKVGHGRKTSLVESTSLPVLLQGLVAPVLQLDDENIVTMKQKVVPDEALKLHLLPSTLKSRQTDVNAPILLERLEEVDTIAPMQVPLLDSTVMLGHEKRSAGGSLPEILATTAASLSKVPLKALSLELSWKPVKLPKGLATSLDLCGVMDPNTAPGPMPSPKQLFAHYTASSALPDPAAAVFVEAPLADVPLELFEPYPALTRGERSRMFKRPLPLDDVLEYDEEDSPPPEKRQLVRRSFLLSPFQQSEPLGHARGTTFHEIDLVSTQPPAHDTLSQDRLLSVTAADDSSSISSLDDLMLVDFPTQTPSVLHATDLQSVQHELAKLAHWTAEDRPSSPHAYADNKDESSPRYPAPDEPDDDLADDIAELLLSKSVNTCEPFTMDTAFNRFFRGRGVRLVSVPLAAANPDESGVNNQASDALSATVGLGPALFTIPANIVASLEPLSFSASDSARDSGLLHKYLVSNSFCQKREILRALEALNNVHMIEREVLGTTPASPTNPDIHIQIDHKTCIIFLLLAELPARFNELFDTIHSGAASCSNIVLVFECFVIRPSEHPSEGLVCDLSPHVFSPAVIKSLDSLKHTLNNAYTNVAVCYAFAETPEAAAKFVRLVGEIAMDRCERETPELLDDLWGERVWLTDEENEEEEIASVLPSLGRLAAILLLSRGCWDDWLDMKPGDRHAYLDLLFGVDRTDRFNAEIAERVQLVLEEYHLSSPAI